MKKLILLLCLLTICIPFLYSQDTESKSLVLWTDGCGGLNTKDASFLIGDNEFTELQNCFTDEISGLSTRGISTQIDRPPAIDTSTAPMHFGYGFKKQNNSKYHILKSSTCLFYQNIVSAGSCLNVIYSTLPVNSTMWAAMYNDTCYLGVYNGDRWCFVDGSTIKVSTAIPQVKYMICAYDKLIGANINSTNQGSRVIYSNIISADILMSSDWGESDWIEIDRDNGENITGIFMYKGNIYVTKPSAIYVLTGLDDSYNTNDGFYQVVNGIGCISQQTIQELDGLVYFAGIGGIYAFDGNNTILISGKINDDYKKLIQVTNYSLDYSSTPLCGLAVDGRYWISGSSITGETNNVVYVLDRNKNWCKMDNLHISCMYIIGDNQSALFPPEFYYGCSLGTYYCGYFSLKEFKNYSLRNYDYEFVENKPDKIKTIAKTKDFNLGTSLNDKNLIDFWVSFSTQNSTDVYSGTHTFLPTIKYNINISSTAYIMVYNPPTKYYDKIPINLNIKQPFERFRYINFAIYDFRELYGIVAFYNVFPRLQ